MSVAVPNRGYDAWSTLYGGVDSGRAPELIGQDQVAFAINRTFRGGYCATRPGFPHVPFSVEGEESTGNFGTARIQGAGFFDPTGSDPMIVAMVGGELYRIDIRSEATVSKITPPGLRNSAKTPRAWMVQANRYLFVQDNQSMPIGYDGGTSWRIDPSMGGMPVGGPMAYGLGRAWVAIGQKFVAGDIFGGPTDPWMFTENQYLAEGGAFELPFDMGPVTGMTFLPRQDTATGAGELLVFGPRGAARIDPSIPREQWKDQPIQSVALMGIGCLSHNSIAAVNGDLFFRANDGIRSYRDARAEIDSWGRTPMDAEVRRAMAYDDDKLAAFSQGIYFDDRYLITTNPIPFGGGALFQGIVALDMTPVASMRAKAPAAYDGIWTGLRVAALVKGVFHGVERAFALCSTGGMNNVNSIWEISKTATVDAASKPIEWSVETRSFTGKNPADLKRLVRGDLWVSDISGQAEISVSWRPDNHPNWVPWHDFDLCASETACERDCGALGALARQYRPQLRLPFPPESCDEAVGRQLNIGHRFQLKIEGSGHATLEAGVVHLQDEQQPVDGDCPGETACVSVDADCSPMFGYESYFVSDKTAIVYCDETDPAAGSASGAGSAISAESQADADAQAQAIADAEAAAALECPFFGGGSGATEDSGFDDYVSSIELTEDGDILAAGAFRSVQGSGAHGLVRLGPTGRRRSAFDTTTLARGTDQKYLQCAHAPGTSDVFLRSFELHAPWVDLSGYALSSSPYQVESATGGVHTADSLIVPFDVDSADRVPTRAQCAGWLTARLREHMWVTSDGAARMLAGQGYASSQNFGILDPPVHFLNTNATMTLSPNSMPTVGLTRDFTLSTAVPGLQAGWRFLADVQGALKHFGLWEITAVPDTTHFTAVRLADPVGTSAYPINDPRPGNLLLHIFDGASGSEWHGSGGDTHGYFSSGVGIPGDHSGDYLASPPITSATPYSGPATLFGGTHSGSLAYHIAGQGLGGPRVVLGRYGLLDWTFHTNARTNSPALENAVYGNAHANCAVSPSGNYGAVASATTVDVFQLSGGNRGLRKTGFSKPTFAAGTAGFGTTPYLLAVDDDGRALITGDFGSVNGVEVPPYQLYRLAEDGDLDTSFPTYASGSAASWRKVASGATKSCAPAWRDTSSVRGGSYSDVLTRIMCAKVQPDGLILVGGGFTWFKGETANRILRLDPNGERA